MLAKFLNTVSLLAPQGTPPSSVPHLLIISHWLVVFNPSLRHLAYTEFCAKIPGSGPLLFYWTHLAEVDYRMQSSNGREL